MALTLLSGPVGSGKTTKLLNSLAEDTPSPQGLFVVPNESIAAELRVKLLKGLQSPPVRPALLGNTILTYASFIRLITERREATLTKDQQALLCYHLLTSQKLRYFRADRLSFGVAREAAHAITALKRNLVTPAKLHAMLETRGGVKELDFLTLFEHYEDDHTKRGLIDQGDLHLLAIKRLTRGDLPKAIVVPRIIFDEFFFPEPGMIDVIKLLTTTLPKTSITISLPKAEHAQLLFADRAARSIEQMAAISDHHEELSALARPEALINVLLARSWRDEVRLVVEEAKGKPGDLAQETVLCCRQGDNVSYDALQLIWEKDRNALLPRSFIPLDTPVVGDFLSAPSIDRLPANTSLVEFTQIATAILHESALQSGWNEDLVDLRDRTQASRSFAGLIALKNSLRGLATSATTIGPLQVSREIFLEILHDALSSQSTPPLRNHRGLPFRLAMFEHGTSVGADRLFLPRMVEGRYPFTLDDRLFFTDPQELGPKPNQLLDAIFPSPDLFLAQEAFLFHTWVSKTRHEVIISFASVDDSGREAIPSYFLEGMGEAIAIDAEIPLPHAATRTGFEEELTRRLMIEEERLDGRGDHPSYHGNITNPEAKKLVRKRFTEGHLSASRLETYTTCPVRFFFESVLGLAPEEEITREIQPKDRGTMIHVMLEHFYSRHLDTFSQAIKDRHAESSIDTIVEGLAEDVFREHATLIRQSSPVLHPFQRRAIQTAVRQVIARELEEARTLPQGPRPFQTEWVFGKEKGSGLEIAIDGEPSALIQGRIDRIDRTSDKKHFLIVDYKSGRTVESVRAKIIDGRHLQLPLYIEAARRLLFPEAEALGGVLLSVLTAEKKYGLLKKEYNGTHYHLSTRSRTILKEDEWEALIATALRHASTCIAAIRDGRFDTRHGECLHTCSFGGACRKQYL